MKRSITTKLLCSMVVFTAFVISVCPVSAETSADFGQGSVIVGYDGSTCNASLGGVLRYDSSNNGCFQFCDGSNWIGTVACGGLSQSCTDDSTVECVLEATRSNDDPEFLPEYIFDGYNILGVTGIYDPFCSISGLSFTDQTDVAENTLITSNIDQVTITGGKACSLSISGDGSPEYQICSDSSCTGIVQTWTSAGTDTISGSPWLQLRLTSGNNPGVTHTATLKTGAANNTIWNVTTAGECTWQSSSDLSCTSCSSGSSSMGTQAECETYCLNNNALWCLFTGSMCSRRYGGSCSCSIIAGTNDAAACSY